MQPGDLDGDDISSNEEAAQVTTTTSTTVETERGQSTADAGAQATTTTAAPTATTAPPPAETTTTVAGSGLGVTTSPTGGTDGIAETGMESMLGPGLVLLALGLAGRRLAGRS